MNPHRDYNWTFWWSLLNSEIHLTLVTLCCKWNGVKSFHFPFFCKEPMSQNDAIFDFNFISLLRLTSSFRGKVLHPHYFLDYIKLEIPNLVFNNQTSHTPLCFTVLSRCLTVDIYTCCWQLFIRFFSSCDHSTLWEMCLSFSKNVPGSIFCLVLDYYSIMDKCSDELRGFKKVLSHYHKIPHISNRHVNWFLISFGPTTGLLASVCFPRSTKGLLWQM